MKKQVLYINVIYEEKLLYIAFETVTMKKTEIRQNAALHSRTQRSFL